MIAKTFGSLLALILLASSISNAGPDAPPPGDSPKPSRELKKPGTRPAVVIPDAILKLKGKTVRILFDLDIDGDGTASPLETEFFTELLKSAGVNVIRLADMKLMYIRGDVLVFGEIELKRDRGGAADDPESYPRLALKVTYNDRRRWMAAEARTAGMQVVWGEKVREFFGLDRGTDAELDRHKEKFLYAQLERPIQPLKFDDVGFSEVLDMLRDLADINIFVNWKLLKDVGIDKDALVTIDLRDVKFSKCLQLVFESVSGAKGKITYEIDSNVLTISTRRESFDETISKAYDVHFLFAEELAPSVRDKRVAALLKLVESIDPPSWGIRDGKPHTVMELNGELIVVQTESNQKLIGNLIKQLPELMTVEKP